MLSYYSNPNIITCYGVVFFVSFVMETSLRVTEHPFFLHIIWNEIKTYFFSWLSTEDLMDSLSPHTLVQSLITLFGADFL